MSTPEGQTLSYAYDGFLETGVAWSGTVTGSFARTFNSDFRVTSTTINGTNAVSYAYDNDGLLTGAGSLAITRDAANGLITGTSVGTVTDSRSDTPFGELTGYTGSVGGSAVYSVTYSRDSLGRITRKQETILGTTDTYDYSYDTAGRLTQAMKTPAGGSPLTTTYAYDTNGNRLAKTDQSGTVAGTYDGQDRLLTYGTTSYSYNANGDLTSKTQNGATITYDYDVFGNLRQVLLDSGIAIDYVIDGRNRRIGKKVNGSLVQGFLYDDQLRVAAELDGAGNLISRFVYGTHVNVPELIIKGATTYRILTDHLGSPRLVINTADGSIVQRLDFDEFGVVVLDTNPGFQPFGFAGGVYNPQTKLVRFGARDYDAATGRWQSRDPIGFSGSLNLYAYVSADPVDLMDPLGLACLDGASEFGSGLWGKRPDRCLCNLSALRARMGFLSNVMGQMESGGIPGGDEGGRTERVNWPLGGDWYIGIPLGPFDPRPKSPDPCIRFCQRVHEWYEHTDRRRYKPFVWDLVVLNSYLEIPAFKTEMGCLRSFL